MNRAKIFNNGQSQAIRLPKKFRFTTSEVSITQLGNCIVLGPIYKDWTQLFNELKSINSDPIYREDNPPEEREILL